MSLDEIAKMNKPFITPAEAAPVLGVNPHSIRIQARDDPSKLGFPVVVMGHRTRIHREGFLRFMRTGCGSLSEGRR